MRAGSTASLTERRPHRLETYGVRRVLDLRSTFEEPARDRPLLPRREKVEWLNVPLFDYDLSDPKLTGTAAPDGNYLIDGYVTMLSNRLAIRQIFEFLADTPPDGAALFHCAAGMDRTGMTAMLLLGLAGVPREQIVADYLYSFAPIEEVDRVVFEGESPQGAPGSWNPLPSRQEAIEFMLDRVEEGYGTVPCVSCGLWHRRGMPRRRAGYACRVRWPTAAHRHPRQTVLPGESRPGAAGSTEPQAFSSRRET